MSTSKRSLQSEDSSPSTIQLPIRVPPTPDESISIAGSAASSGEIRVSAGPAKPGVVRSRDQGVLSRLPPGSDALETFAKLRREGDMSDEEAFLKFISTYDVSISTLNRISGKFILPLACMTSLFANIDEIANKLPASFSNVKYRDIAPYAWLDPTMEGRDIHRLDAFRSRIPIDMFRKIYADVSDAALLYGRMEFHDNEEARSRFITSVSCPSHFRQPFNKLSADFFQNCVSVRKRACQQTRGVIGFRVYEKGKNRTSFLRYWLNQRYFHRNQEDVYCR